MEFYTLTASDGASSRICTQGAHVCSWIPAHGTEQLFLSKTSGYAPGVAIRGGVPVIFPQFASTGPLPKHGFARTAEWQLLSQSQHDNGAAVAVFGLQDNTATLALWPHPFRAELSVSVLGNIMEIALTIHNTGGQPFSFTSALHTYLAVTDIHAASLHGLQGCRYRDSLTNTDDCVEHAGYLHIDGETDRIYANAPALLRLQQPHQHVQIRKQGFADVVVWNPGNAAAGLSDLESGGEQRMLCVEAATVLQPLHLAPGASWTGSQTLIASVQSA